MARYVEFIKLVVAWPDTFTVVARTFPVVTAFET
jgi:hypothetical protein